MMRLELTSCIADAGNREQRNTIKETFQSLSGWQPTARVLRTVRQLEILILVFDLLHHDILLLMDAALCVRHHSLQFRRAGHGRTSFSELDTLLCNVKINALSESAAAKKLSTEERPHGSGRQLRTVAMADNVRTGEKPFPASDKSERNFAPRRPLLNQNITPTLKIPQNTPSLQGFITTK